MTLTVLEPATEAVLAEIPRAGVEEADAAVARAKAAYPAWRAVAPATARGCCTGSPTRSRRAARSSRSSRRATPASRSATRAARWAWSSTRSATTRRRRSGCSATRSRWPAASAMTFREPLGVVGADHAVELPADDRVVEARAGARRRQHGRAQARRADAADRASSSSAIALDAGIPEGVVNVVAGPGATCGQRLVEHPDVAKVAFTGSTEVGRSIAAGAAQTIKRVTLELGGKSANVVFADADIQAAAAAAPVAVFGNAGPGLLRALADPRRALGARRVHGGVRGGGRGDQGRRPARRGDRDGAADLRRPARDRRVVRARRRAGGDPRLGARRPGLLVPADRAVPGRAATTARCARRSSGRWRWSSRSATRRRRWRSPTTRSTASPARCGRATARRRCGSRAGSRPA